MKRKTYLRNQMQYYSMLLIPLGILLVFDITPMFGLVMAFQNYKPTLGFLGSNWIGLGNFEFILQLPEIWRLAGNTLEIAVLKIVCDLTIPVIFALILNEVKNQKYKRTVQTIVYLPHFLSWVILATLFRNLLSSDGVINQVIRFLGGETIYPFTDNRLYVPFLIITDAWKGFGYGAIIYLAAITGIDPALYESAMMDGATRIQRIVHITIPGIMPIIVLKTMMSLGSILNAGFDQIFATYNPLVYETGDIIDTYIYRFGLVQRQYSLSAAIGMIKSVIAAILILISNFLATKFSDYRVF
ncbi:MAG: sugar ABC transporter permease [Clostridia bacterium]|nr:sugar ABC transporter permease [Clostridia bacterium]